MGVEEEGGDVAVEGRVDLDQPPSLSEWLHMFEHWLRSSVELIPMGRVGSTASQSAYRVLVHDKWAWAELEALGISRQLGVVVVHSNRERGRERLTYAAHTAWGEAFRKLSLVDRSLSYWVRCAQMLLRRNTSR